MTQDKPQGFYIGSWGMWGWIETALKVIAAVFGIAAFAATSNAGELIIGGNPELLALIVMAGLTTNPLISLPLRIGQKEIISIVFTVFSLLGHAGLLIALARDPLNARGYGIAFGVFYTMGELAKMRFLQVSGYTEFGLQSSSMVMGVRVVAAAYALLTILLLI
jgi:hypothetical protein